MSSRGNLFANVENEFEFCDTPGVIERAHAAFCDLTMALAEAQIDGPQGIRGGTLAAIILAAAKCGTEGESGLNDREKQLADAIFDTFNRATGSDVNMEEIYPELAGPLSESERKLLEVLANGGFGMPLLRLILGFAYADGELGDETAAELESMFALALMADFAQSGQESVPAPQIRVSSLEKRIAEWFRAEDSVYTLDNVCEHFPQESRADVQNALDSLVEKGVLFAPQTFMGKMYALE